MQLAYEAIVEFLSRSGGTRFCFTWLSDEFKRQGLNPYHLRQLCMAGWLRHVDSARGGRRAYYELTIP